MTRDLDEVQTRVPWYGVPTPHVDPEVKRAVRGRVPDNHADFDGQRTTYGGRSPSPHDAAPPSEPPAPVSEPAGRGAAWTEERGTSDEGRRRSEGGMGRRAGPRRRAGDTASTGSGYVRLSAGPRHADCLPCIGPSGVGRAGPRGGGGRPAGAAGDISPSRRPTPCRYGAPSPRHACWPAGRPR